MPKGTALTDAEKKKREEAKATKFKELGSKRLNKALTAINALIPLANKNGYSSTADQHKKINDALSGAVKRVADAFAGTKVSSGGIEL